MIGSWTGGSNSYTLTGGFGATNIAGPINYILSYTDAAGNPGTVSGTNIYTLDTIDPTFHSFTVTGSAKSGVKFSWNTSKSALYTFQFNLSGTTSAPFASTSYGTSHTYTSTALATGKQYAFAIKITDALQNSNIMSGTVAVNASGNVSVTIATQGNNILQLSSQVEAKLFSQILKEEIQNFEECKADLDLKKIDLDLGANKQITFEIPKVEKTTTRTILNAFAQVLAGKLKTANLSKSQLEEVETRSNNFFAVTAILE